MKWIDLIRLAARTLKGRWAALPVVGVAVAAFCLCFAGAVFTTVQQEKALPYELIVSSEGAVKLSDRIIAEISNIPDVVAVTAVLHVPVTIKTGKYAAQLTLAGMDAAYLREPFSQGSGFPDSSVMPYIVLNDAACKLFSDGETSSDKETPEIDWLSAGFSLQIGEGGLGVTSKVCGILAEEEKKSGQEPVSYISLSAAKQLLRKSGQSTDYSTAHVRVPNIGEAHSVSRAIAALGMTVTNSNEESQARWDAALKEIGYLLAMGVLGLLCSAVLLSAQRKILDFEQKGALEMLRWLGMRRRDMIGLFLLKSLMLLFSGIAAGLIVGLSLPSFLPPELAGASYFTLSIPPGVAAASAVICIAAGLVPFIKRHF
jgi:hypothetical protein